VNWGFVGGRDFEAQDLTGLLESVPLTDTVIVGSGIGSEKFVREQSRELGRSLLVPDLRPDLYDWDPAKPVEVGEPPSADTRLMMLARLDQVISYGQARAAQRVNVKHRGATDSQVADVVVACLDGKLVLMGGGRAKAATEIVKRCTSIGTYDNPRARTALTPRWEVIEL